MISKKQYYPRFKSSLDEQLSGMRELPIGAIKSIIEPKLCELSNEFDGEELLLKILILGNSNLINMKKLSNGIGNDDLIDDLVNIQTLDKPIKAAYTVGALTIHAIFYGENTLNFEYAGLFEGQLGIVVFADKASLCIENFELIKQVFRQHSFLWFLKDADLPYPQIELADNIVATEWANLDDESASLAQLLQRPDFLSKMAVTQSLNSLLAIDTLSIAANKFVKEAERQNKISKLLLPIQQSTPMKGLQETDPFTSVKYNIQYQLNQLEKSVGNQLEMFFLPATGAFWGKVFSTIDTLKQLETTEKAKTNMLKVPDKARDLFLTHTRNVLESQFLKVSQLVNDALRVMNDDINKTTVQKGIGGIDFFITPLSDKESQIALDSVIRLERPYEANVQRKGFYEYFMAVRKYQMIFIMFISLFGIGSYIRKQPKIMITATLILTGFGAYSLRKTVKQEREEQAEKELEKAREVLREEVKRMGSETVQHWRKQLTEYFKGLNNQLIKQVEETAQSYLIRKHTVLEDEKRMQQRMLQNIDNADKLYVSFFRSQDMWQRNQQRLKSELKSEFLRIK